MSSQKFVYIHLVTSSETTVVLTLLL